MKLKNLFFLLAIVGMVFVTACDDSKKDGEEGKDGEKAQSGWSKVEKEKFIESCEAGLEGQEMIDGPTYCACMLEKLEGKFKNAIEAQNMNQDEMQEWAMECMQ